MSRRILVVDPEESSAALIAERLVDAGFDAVRFASGAAALDEVARDRPAALLIEILLPDMSGTEVLRRLRDDPRTRQIPVVLVTTRSAEIDRVIGFELGADDYVTKPYSPRELVLRVQALLRRARGTNGGTPEQILIGPLVLDVHRHDARVNGTSVPLTALEFRLLLDLARRRGRVQRREELLERVWEDPKEVDVRTVDSHVKRIREKLGEAGDWLETVRGVGYRLRE
jgi:two-component system phosphate regulon response regulator PhoB